MAASETMKAYLPLSVPGVWGLVPADRDYFTGSRLEEAVLAQFLPVGAALLTAVGFDSIG